MKTFLIISALFCANIIQAQTVNTRVVGNSTYTNTLNVAKAGNGAVKLFTVLGQNASSSTAYVQVFNSTTNPANGTIPVFSVPVPASPQYYSIDFGYYGADFDAVTICISTNANTLGLASTNFTIQAITRSN